MIAFRKVQNSLKSLASLEDCVSVNKMNDVASHLWMPRPITTHGSGITMKITAALMTLAILAASSTDSDQRYSILVDEGPVLADHGPMILQDQATVLERPIILQDSLAPARPTHSNDAPIILDHNFAAPDVIAVPDVVVAPSVVVAPAPNICTECRCVTCCCKPKRKIETTFCLVDTHGCKHDACVRVPACCANEAPQISWERRRLLGRQVATLCWECCDHEVKIVITRRGKVKVRD